MPPSISRRVVGGVAGVESRRHSPGPPARRHVAAVDGDDECVARRCPATAMTTPSERRLSAAKTSSTTYDDEMEARRQPCSQVRADGREGDELKGQCCDRRARAAGSAACWMLRQSPAQWRSRRRGRRSARERRRARFLPGVAVGPAGCGRSAATNACDDRPGRTVCRRRARARRWRPRVAAPCGTACPTSWRRRRRRRRSRGPPAGCRCRPGRPGSPCRPSARGGGGCKRFPCGTC